MKRLNERQKKWIERTAGNNRIYRRFLHNRFYMFLLAVAFQLFVYGYFAYTLAYNSPWAFAIQVVLFVLEVVSVLYILNAHERPSSKLNWIILILLAPAFGFPMYLMNGRGRPARKMKRKLLASYQQGNKTYEEVYGETPIPKAGERKQALCRHLAKYAHYPVFHRGSVSYYASGKEMFAAMKEELKKAEKFILLEYFILAHGKMWSEILQILLEKAMQGVKIRIIYDDFGCMLTLSPKYSRYLEGLHENIRCLQFNKVIPFFALRMNHRDHKKIMVIDGKVGFTGGINLADEYIDEKKRFGYWKDTGVKITGESVRSMTKSFFYVWNAFRKDKEDVREYLLHDVCEASTKEESGLCIQPYDDSPLDRLDTGATVYTDIINRAEKYVWIFTPYLVLDEHLRSALCLAAARGVDVRIVTPSIPDKKIVFRLTRANYGILLESGVRIYEYTPGFIHAKSVVSDDDSAVVGTINFDYRSLYHHFENAVYFTAPDAVMALKRDCEETFAISKERTLENTKRGWVGRIVDSVLRVFETLL